MEFGNKKVLISVFCFDGETLDDEKRLHRISMKVCNISGYQDIFN